ncbi:MAG: FIG00740931: hypothetical protein, partial [uncultured Thermomicrobiales bacterium]
ALTLRDDGHPRFDRPGDRLRGADRIVADQGPEPGRPDHRAGDRRGRVGLRRRRGGDRPRPRPRRRRRRDLRPSALRPRPRPDRGRRQRRDRQHEHRRRCRSHRRRRADGADRPGPGDRVLRLRLAELRHRGLRQLPRVPRRPGRENDRARRPPGDRVLRTGSRLERAPLDRSRRADAAVLVPVRARGARRRPADPAAARPTGRAPAAGVALVGLRHRARAVAARRGGDDDRWPRPDRSGGQPLLPQGRAGREQRPTGGPVGPHRRRTGPPGGHPGRRPAPARSGPAARLGHGADRAGRPGTV